MVRPTDQSVLGLFSLAELCWEPWNSYLICSIKPTWWQAQVEDLEFTTVQMTARQIQLDVRADVKTGCLEKAPLIAHCGSEQAPVVQPRQRRIASGDLSCWLRSWLLVQA